MHCNPSQSSESKLVPWSDRILAVVLVQAQMGWLPSTMTCCLTQKLASLLVLAPSKMGAQTKDVLCGVKVSFCRVHAPNGMSAQYNDVMSDMKVSFFFVTGTK